LSGWVLRGIQCDLQRARGDLCGLGWSNSGGADLGGNAGFMRRESESDSGPIESDAQAGQLFEEGVNGCAQNAGSQAAFVAGVKAWTPKSRNSRFNWRRNKCFRLLSPVVHWQTAQQGWLDGRWRGWWYKDVNTAGRCGEGFDLDLLFALFFGLAGGLPVFESGANLFFKCGPGGRKQAGGGIQQRTFAIGFDFI